MRIVIIEDEKPAAEKIVKFLEMYDNKIKIETIIPSVQKGLEWFECENNSADLIIADIQLTDGTSFDIFSNIEINQPIIFTTAYNEYAIEAFKLNSIDYLLKPVTFEDLYKSLEKIQKLRESLPTSRRFTELEQLSQQLTKMQPNYKDRFMVKVGEHIRSFTSESICLFYAEGRDVCLVNTDLREYLIDYKLDDLNDILDPKTYFRINRSVIANINSISEVLVHSGSRLKIKLAGNFDKELIVSRERVSQFKDWFNGYQ